MMSDNRPIGVFDSGVGGLTVLDKMIEQMPCEKFLYVADQGYCPYGIKSKEQIASRVVSVGKFLLSKGVKAIVIACNTASLYIDELRKITDIPVISVIEPTCLEAISLTKTKEVAVLATKATIEKGKYQHMLEEYGIKPYGIACSEFVDFVEQGDLTNPIGQKIVDEKIKTLLATNVDTVIHGCTHFSLLEPFMIETLGAKHYVACGKPTCERLKKILMDKNILNLSNDEKTLIIYTTGNKRNTIKTMKWFGRQYEDIVEVTI